MPVTRTVPQYVLMSVTRAPENASHVLRESTEITVIWTVPLIVPERAIETQANAIVAFLDGMEINVTRHVARNVHHVRRKMDVPTVIMENMAQHVHAQATVMETVT